MRITIPADDKANEAAADLVARYGQRGAIREAVRRADRILDSANGSEALLEHYGRVLLVLDPTLAA
jgi:hypothetical protein